MANWLAHVFKPNTERCRIIGGDVHDPGLDRPWRRKALDPVLEERPHVDRALCDHVHMEPVSRSDGKIEEGGG